MKTSLLSGEYLMKTPLNTIYIINFGVFGAWGGGGLSDWFITVLVSLK